MNDHEKISYDELPEETNMLEDERENEKEGNTECEEEETMEEVLADEKAQPEDTDSSTEDITGAPSKWPTSVSAHASVLHISLCLEGQFTQIFFSFHKS